jgi:hypothetical protein
MPVIRLVKEVPEELNVFGVLSNDHFTPATGKILTVRIKKSGGAFAASSPTVTEREGGWYSFTPSAAELDTVGSFLVHCTATGMDDIDKEYQVVARGDLISGAVNDASPSATTFITDLPSATDNFYEGQLLVWRTGAMVKISEAIIAYDGATKRVTTNTFPAAPANGDKFSITNGT